MVRVAESMKTVAVSWADLPPELLDLVVLRVPSLADRFRLRAVCRPWRAAALPQRALPPPLPWLALRDGGLVDLGGAPVRCAPILCADADFGYLAVDNLAFLVHRDGHCSLMNPLSGLRLPLPKLGPLVRRIIDESGCYNQSYIPKAYMKAVLSSPLNSTPDPLVALVILDGHCIVVSACRKDSATGFAIPPDPPRIDARIDDIAFFPGKLYALTRKEGLYAIELDAHHLPEPESRPAIHQCIANDPGQKDIYYYTQQEIRYHGPENYIEYVVMRYLAESNGRLLMIKRWMGMPLETRMGMHDRTFQFEVFQADLASDPGRWTKVDSLCGQAIFLGSECSKSVLASRCTGGVQEDCIYFMHQIFDNRSSEIRGPCVNPLADSGVYNMRSGEIKPFLAEAVMAELQGKRQFLTWFFPSDD